MDIEKRLKDLKLILPEVQSAGLYAPAVKTGSLVFVSGQLPKSEGKIVSQGRVGREINLDAGKRAARVCVLNALAALKTTLGSLDKIKRIVKVTGYVASAIGFNDQHKVIDGASELLKEIFGENGEHARAAVGVADLPLRASVEVELIVEI